MTPTSSPSSGLTAGVAEDFKFTFTTHYSITAGQQSGVTISFMPPSGPGVSNNPWGLSGITKGASSSAVIGDLVVPSGSDPYEPVFATFNDTVSGGSTVTIHLANVVAPQNAGAYTINLATVENGAEKDKATLTVFVGNLAYIVGKVVKVDGETVTPLSNKWVMVRSRDWSFQVGSNTGSDGKFYISGMSAGDYLIEVGMPGPEDTSTDGFLAPAAREVTFSSTTLDLSTSSDDFFKFTKAVKTITGYVKKNDGTAVSGAQVSANKKGAMGSPNMTTTGADGSYTLYVGGGEWELFVSPGWNQETNSQASVDWTFAGRPPTVSFKLDSTVETKSQDIEVIKATAKVKGKVVKPDGTALTMAGIGVWSMSGIGTGGGLDMSGAFEVSVPAGTYQIGIFADSDDFAAPAGLTATVVDNQTLDMGTIKMVVKDSVISGKVVDESGNGIAGIDVHAFSEGMGGGMPRQTGSDGTYSIKVTAGSWMVMAEVGFNSSLNYANTQPPRKVTIGSKETVTGINFTLVATNARISGQITDANGTLLSDFWGFAFVEGAMGPGSGGPVEGGKFVIKVAAGTYEVGVGSPPGSNYTADSRETVTVAKDETKSVTIKAKANDAKIIGSLKDDEGNPITSAIEVIAENGSGGFQHQLAMGGSYSLNVSAGTWRIGFWDISGSGYMSDSVDDNKVTVASGGSATKDIVLKKANATIKGKVTKPDGTAMSMAFVTVDNRAGQKDLDDGKRMMENGTMTDANGEYTLRVPAGTYYVQAHIPPGQGYISPDRTAVSVAKNGEATVNMVFKLADAKITGKVTKGGSAAYGAFVWAWGEKGGFSETRVNALDGSYEVQVTKGDNWHIGAVMEDGKKVYKSAETIVSVTGATVSQDLAVSESSLTLPDPVTVTFDATDMKVANLSDGTSISIPANAMATSGNITLTATPKAELKSQQNAKPIGIGYDFTATNASGSAVTNFNSSISITVPYTEQQLTDMKVTENDLNPSYYDETGGTWRNVGTSAVNKDANTVTFTTDHFTQFALTAAADTTPPSAPTSVAVAKSGSGSLTVTWTNPTSDFSYAKVYRSTTSGSIGTVVANNQTGTSYVDTSLTNGTTYYYTVRAVDAAGNESINTTQTSGTPSSTSDLPDTGSPFLPPLAALVVGVAGLAIVKKSR
jgi:hypothetical protein